MVTMLISERLVEISERIEYLDELIKSGDRKPEYMDEISVLSLEGHDLSQMNPNDEIAVL